MDGAIAFRLCVLAVAIAFVTIARRSLGENGSLIAAIIWLTNFGIIEKGRLIEIEALYVSLFAIAIHLLVELVATAPVAVANLDVPFVFLGLGLLAKGPVHLVFLLCDRRRSSVAHAKVARAVHTRAFRRHRDHAWDFRCVGDSLFADDRRHECCACLVATILRPFARRRFQISRMDPEYSAGLGYFLPWILFLPFPRAEFADENDRRLVRGLGWGIACSFLVVSLIPGSLPRYTMPLIAPMCWLMASLLCAERLDMPRWLDWRIPHSLGRNLDFRLLSRFVAGRECRRLCAGRCAAITDRARK